MRSLTSDRRGQGSIQSNLQGKVEASSFAALALTFLALCLFCASGSSNSLV